jgi:hypothetical protein
VVTVSDAIADLCVVLLTYESLSILTQFSGEAVLCL